MAIEVDSSRYPRTAEADLRGERRKQQEHFIDTFLEKVREAKGLKEVYAHFDPELLCVITSMDTKSKRNWDRFFDLEGQMVQQFSGTGIAVLFDEADLYRGGKEELENKLPEGSILVYPKPEESAD